MPTYEVLSRFTRDLAGLEPSDRERFRTAVRAFVEDLRSGEGFRPGLRVKRVQATADVWEMTFAPDGRATWQYGTETVPGQTHVVWRRVGTHGVLPRP